MILRIEAGIRKYWGAWAEPFLIVLRGTGKDQLDSTAVPLSAPLPTITAGGGHIALISPIWLDQSHTKTSGVSGRIIDPLNTICCSHGTHSVVTPLFIPQQSAGTVKPCIGNPIPTIATSGAVGVATPFLMEYYGNGTAHPVTEPVPVIPTHDRFGLVQGRILTLPDGQRFKLDITHRMLTAKELAAATSFPDDYVFAGNGSEIKKQIGNAVPPVLAEALYRAFLAA